MDQHILHVPIDPDLRRRAKVRALEEDTTLALLVSAALEAHLAKKKEKK
jgi:hypothetical protein